MFTCHLFSVTFDSSHAVDIDVLRIRRTRRRGRERSRRRRGEGKWQIQKQERTWYELTVAMDRVTNVGCSESSQWVPYCMEDRRMELGL